VDGVVTNYVYDGDQVVAEYDGVGGLLQSYVYGTGIDEPILMENASGTYYYHTDGLGSVSALSDSDGNLTEDYKYDIFGEVIGSLSGVGNPYYFTGRRYDEEMALYYYRARAYDPEIGRFLQTDPITWGPDDRRILEKTASLYGIISSLYAFSVHNIRKEDIKEAVAIITEITPEYRPTSPTSIRGFANNTIIQLGLLDPQLKSYYNYCFNNPVNYLDPQGEIVLWLAITSGILVVVLIVQQIARYANPEKAPDIPDPPGPPIKPVTPPAPQPYHPPGGCR